MIKIENISIQYPDGRTALSEISGHIAPGERVAVLGANGAGKTSLLMALVGLIPLQTGRLEVAGTELTPKTVKTIRLNCGLLFQNPDDQLFSIKVRDDIAFGPQNLGWSNAVITAKTQAVMELLGITLLADYPPHKLSGGEKRKVALAGVLVMEPRIILFDEPTAFLDPRSQRELADIISGLGQTCLIATHDLAFAQKVCAKAILLNEGRLVYAGKLEKLLADNHALTQYGLI